MGYYQDINIWSLYGDKLTVAENNDHLGLVVSGTDEEVKNVDKNISSARDTLFSFLGNIFSYKCKLSPIVQHYTWSVYIKPVLTSGLAALPLRPPVIKTISIFHHKILRALLKLSPYSPVAPLYFLFGELPIEAALHLDILSVFWNIWRNPQTKIFEVVKYLLKMCDESSLTWSAHLKLLFQLYNLPDPLLLLSSTPWTKERWKQHTQTAVTSHHEAIWRDKATSNYKLQYLNVKASGLSGRPHPVLLWILTTQDTIIVRPHLKMLAGDYLCYVNLAHDRGIDPHCRLCQALSSHPAPAEDLVHLLTRCRGTADTRNRVMPNLLNTIAQHFPSNRLLTNPAHIQLHLYLIRLHLSPVTPVHHAEIVVSTLVCTRILLSQSARIF